MYSPPSLDDTAAAEVLTDNTVHITRTLRLKVMMPYFVENRCVTLTESEQLFNSNLPSDNVIQFINVVSRRGVAAFRGFLKALEQYTAYEPGEGALIELLNKLREDAANRLPTASIRGVEMASIRGAEPITPAPDAPDPAPLLTNEEGKPNDGGSAAPTARQVSYHKDMTCFVLLVSLCS